MRLFAPIALAALLAVAPCGLAKAEKKENLKTVKDRASYAVGLSIGRNLVRQGVEVEMGPLVQGMRHAIKGDTPLLTPEEIREALAVLNARIREKRRKSTAEVATKNKGEGAAFLTANKKKKGVVTLPSGLQYKVLAAGKGKKPQASDSVVTHYRGTLIDGTEFDSSYTRGEPATFPVRGVIAGWTEALQLMAVGSKWKLFVPANLAYGDHGSGSRIGPHAVLIFEIELLGIK
jgi:FKBP-type peptidyl-prolyl cis-trans isomerase FklB